MEAFDRRLSSAGALADDLRRALYLFIRAQRRPVGRDEAAEAAGVSRKLAAFHLDKLVERGLLEARYVRLSGRTGPGAGRPSKVYFPSEREVSISIPFRSYEVAGEILLDALESDQTSAGSSVRAAARQRGRALGEHERRSRGLGPVHERRALQLAFEVLSEQGYEPYYDDSGALRLHNCPFHGLAQRSPELVCGMNKTFIEGLLDGIGDDVHEAVLDPRPGECCVRVQPKGAVA